MMAAIRLISVQRGYDPREFVLVAFGGAGPLHANSLAAAMGLPTVLIPPSPGVASAVGLLMTDIKHEFVATRRQLLATVQAAEVSGEYQAFEDNASRLLGDEREDWLSVSQLRTMDLRYRGQSHELQVTLPGGTLSDADLARARTQFEEAHQRAYGYVAPDDPIELVNIRLTAIGKLPELTRKTVEPGSGDSSGALRSERKIWLKDSAREENCPVYDRYLLRSGDRLAGPALIEEMDSCTVVLPGFQATVDQHGNLLLSAQ
jgi:N-methylhydantoinase A